jgi:hypothetical protein
MQMVQEYPDIPESCSMAEPTTTGELGPSGRNERGQGGAVSVNPGFGNKGNPSDFLLSRRPITEFYCRLTNNTILHAGPNHPAIMPPRVPQTYP